MIFESTIEQERAVNNPTRRQFLAWLGFGTVAAAAAATSVFDVEQLLWVPGEKTIFLPPLIEGSVPFDWIAKGKALQSGKAIATLLNAGVLGPGRTFEDLWNYQQNIASQELMNIYNRIAWGEVPA